ncbi:MAG: tetratricopeptide repeat protein [Desulfobacterales bacterium]|nr:tetratricopeptide repeat protein [Desulfobacterales bacterium]
MEARCFNARGKGRKNPKQDVLIELLEVYTSISSKDRIISVLKRLIKLDPGDVSLRSRLAEALEERGKKEEAIKEYETLLKQLNKPDSLSVKIRLAYLYTETDQFEKAISYYLKAVELDQKNANLYYNLAYLYDKIGKKEKGDSYLARAVALKTEDVDGRLKLAQNLINKKRFKEAEKYLLEILEKKPESIDTLILIAGLREKQGEKQKLKDVYNKILVLDPKNETVLCNLGILEYETGNLKAGLACLKKYLETHPKDRAIHEIVFNIYKRQKNDPMAFEQAKVLLMLGPPDMSLYNFAFSHLNAKGDYEHIINIMEKGVKANPKQMELREYLALAFLKTGKNDLALAQIKEILKAKPKDIDLLIRLARLYEKQGNISGASDAYKKVLDISPTHEAAGEAYLRLRLMGVKGKPKPD